MQHTPIRTVKSGATPVMITACGFGGAPLGGLFSGVSEDAAMAALDAAWDAGMRYFDTAPLYGYGLSEQRLGKFLQSKPRDEFVLSTKVGRLLQPTRGGGATGGSLAAFVDALPNDATYDFSADGVNRSLADSLGRLGLDRVDIVYVHDPDDYFEIAIDQAFPVLRALRDAGVVRAIGAGMNQWQMLERFVEQCDLDVVLVAGRYSLLDRTAAATFLPLCTQRNVAVIAAGIFNSGILAHVEPAGRMTYDYVAAPAAVLARAQAMARVCARFGTTLPSAAIQFPLRHPAIAGVLCGMRSPVEVNENIARFNERIPAELWNEIEKL